MLIQNKIHHQLTHVDVENERFEEDTYIFENSFAFHKVDLNGIFRPKSYLLYST